MQKKVESVIASAMMLIRKPSEQALPLEDRRLLLHNLIERYTQQALRANEDFATHEMECILIYSDNLLAFDVEVSGYLDNTEFDPVALYYQRTEQDAERDDWYKVNLVDYETYPSISTQQSIAGSFYSNNWDGVESLKLKLNITEETVATFRWRLAFRLFPDAPADYGDYVAFPPRFTTLLEYALALSALPLVLDDSPSYQNFAMKRSSSLGMELMRLEAQFSDYLERPVNARLVTPQGYHYRTNNPFSHRTRRLTVERRS
jgi:hypothetical protein